MGKLRKSYLRHRDAVLVLLGLLAVSMITLPYLVLGEGSYVQVHDQLDGEVLNYMYQARYLGEGHVIPQFMNGMDKASMLPPAPLGVLLYRLLPPFAAYGVMHWLCLAVGFSGMYFLGRQLKIRPEAAWATACLFCYIPFYPVYGLAALGQPMLVLCALRLGAETAGGDKGRGARENRTGKNAPGGIWGGRSKFLEVIGCYLAVALYGACSSLTLVGYAWVAAGFLWSLFLAAEGWRKKRGFQPALRVGGAALTLAGVYLATNLDLLRALSGDGFTTHRQEMALRAVENPMASFRELLFSGGSYSPVYSAGILAAAILLVLAFCRKTPQKGRGVFTAAWTLIGLLICAALLAVLWNSSPVVSLRLSAGGALTYFQADRIYWCFPFLWMLVLGLLLESICRWGETLRRAARVIPALCCALLVAVEGLQILRDSPLNKNIRLMLLPDYKQTTWESIYMDDVFARIDQVIGAGKDHYSVVSLGIYPSVALYHGYTCADGYSNNYDLAYKHRFRRIMARELEENPEALRYFDEWGNRLYLAGAPYGINGMVSGGQSPYTDLDYDLSAMQDLNIRYLLAAAPVELSRSAREQTGLRLELVEGSPFTDDTAYYEVWVYQIAADDQAASPESPVRDQ